MLRSLFKKPAICVSSGSHKAMMFSVLTPQISEDPFPPTPTQPMFSVSLGAWKPRPPSTCRGTIIMPAAAVAVPPKNSRLVSVLTRFSGFSLLDFMNLFPPWIAFVIVKT
ncbi:MAG: hypothetical protein NTV82_18025 [Candidatus Aminicenantes bacterium]|nr:hypothetical protein [Candidatus Aminicenantes bacterium]